jgi:cytoskeletal protein RodZ
MSQLGERLRLARESLGLPLAQAALDTRILQRYLVALEEGDFKHLPGDVYARGFIRNYAHYLGLPTDELIELYRHERGVSDAIRIVPATTAPKVRSYVLPNFFGVFFITVALLGLSYIALSALGRIGNGNQVAQGAASPTVPPPTPLPTFETNQAVQVAAIPTPGATATVEPTGAGAGFTFTPVPTATPQAPIIVKVSVKAGSASWLRIQADGVTEYEGIMKDGETRDFQAQRKIFIRSGNPAVVFVSVNGLEQQVLGPLAGKPINWEWPPQ